MSAIGEFLKTCRLRGLSLDMIEQYSEKVKEIRTKAGKPNETAIREVIKEIEAKHPLPEEAKTE